MFHHPSELHSPRHVFASVNLPISPPSLVCGLHPFFKALVRLPLAIHGKAEDLEFLFKRESMESCLGTHWKTSLSSESEALIPPQVFRLRCQIPLLNFLNQILQHLFPVTFAMGHDPEVVGVFFVFQSLKGRAFFFLPNFISHLPRSAWPSFATIWELRHRHRLITHSNMACFGDMPWSGLIECCLHVSTWEFGFPVIPNVFPRHHRGESDGPVASNPFLWFGEWFS